MSLTISALAIVVSVATFFLTFRASAVAERRHPDALNANLTLLRTGGSGNSAARLEHSDSSRAEIVGKLTTRSGRQADH